MSVGPIFPQISLAETKNFLEVPNSRTIIMSFCSHWRHTDFAQSLLSLLIREDIEYSPEAVLKYVNLLCDDSATTRKMAISLIGAWLKAKRPKTVKTEHMKLPPNALRVGGNYWKS